MTLPVLPFSKVVIMAVLNPSVFHSIGNIVQQRSTRSVNIISGNLRSPMYGWTEMVLLCTKSKWDDVDGFYSSLWQFIWTINLPLDIIFGKEARITSAQGHSASGTYKSQRWHHTWKWSLGIFSAGQQSLQSPHRPWPVLNGRQDMCFLRAIPPD